MGSWSTLVPSTVGWASGLDTWQLDNGTGGGGSRGKTRLYCTKALKELVLTCRNHSVPCRCLAANLPAWGGS